MSSAARVTSVEAGSTSVAPIWIGSPTDVRVGQAAVEALCLDNDSRYYDQQVGIVRVDYDRWRRAQDYELHGWTRAWRQQSHDRNEEHKRSFDGYSAVGPDLGRVLEVGCGPFTQLQTIIAGRVASHVTLLDPLLGNYLSLPHCPYRDGSFLGLPTTLMEMMVEEMTAVAEFDTVICINVLEHVLDAMLALHNLNRALRPGGTLIFAERSYDGFNPELHFDVGHPIRVKRVVLDHFLSRFRQIFRNGDYFIGIKTGN